jgi:AraC family transcriptional regulator
MDTTAIRDLNDWVTGFASLQERMRKRLAAPAAQAHDRAPWMPLPALHWRDLGFERVRLGVSQDLGTERSGRHIVVLVLGRGTIHFGDTAHQVQPGSVVFFPQGAPAQWKADAPVDTCILALERRLIDRVAKQSYGVAVHDYRLQAVIRSYDFGVIGLAGVLAGESDRSLRGNNLYVNSLASILAAHLLRHYADWRRKVPDIGHRSAYERTLPAPEAVQRAIVFIRENHTRDLGVTEIADAVGVNAFVLKRLFWESLGTEPVQYLLQLRMQSAESLLDAGARALPEIAHAVGFGDQSALFTRAG